MLSFYKNILFIKWFPFFKRSNRAKNHLFSDIFTIWIWQKVVVAEEIFLVTSGNDGPQKVSSLTAQWRLSIKSQTSYKIRKFYRSRWSVDQPTQNFQSLPPGGTETDKQNRSAQQSTPQRHWLKKGRLSGASKMSYWKHSAQDNSKTMASIQNLFTVGNLGYSLYLMPKRKSENCL